jgi:hypothetical protein
MANGGIVSVFNFVDHDVIVNLVSASLHGAYIGRFIRGLFVDELVIGNLVGDDNWGDLMMFH